MAATLPGPYFAVLPTIVLAGPAAILAVLCPAALAVLALFWRRWAVLLLVASMVGALYCAHAWFRGQAAGAWWGTPTAVWLAAAAAAVAGAALACCRARAALRSGQAAALRPVRVERVLLVALGVLGLGATLYALHAGVLLRWPWREGLPLWCSVWAGGVSLLRERTRRHWPAPSALTTEVALLAGLGLGCVLVGSVAGPRPAPEVAWVFEAVERGLILSAPRVDGDRVYVSAAHVSTRGPSGAVYCLDRATGKALWSFNRGGRMKQALSTPALASGRLFVGEGLHQDVGCRLYCLDAASGRELWSFATSSHVESSPRVVGGLVFFGAGDDGVYCLDAAAGALRWHFPGPHVDTTPAVAGGRLYAGGGYGAPEMFCLDTATGRPVWRVPSDLPVFGSPAVAGDQVFFGAGGGKLNRSDSRPAGALVCLDAATGRRLWRYPVADAVMSSPAASGDRVFFGSRDCHCYCLGRRDGRLDWRRDLGSPVVAAPVVAGVRVYAVASAGPVYCLDAGSGSMAWQFDVGKHACATPEFVSALSLAQSQGTGKGLRLYLAGGLHTPISYAAVVYCLKDPAGEE